MTFNLWMIQSMSTIELVGVIAIWSVLISFLLGILTLQVIIRYMDFSNFKLTLTPDTKRKLNVWNTTVKSLETAFLPFIVILCIMIPCSLLFEFVSVGFFSIIFFILPFFIILGQFKILWSYYRDFGKLRAFLSFVVWWGPSFLISILLLFITNTYMVY